MKARKFNPLAAHGTVTPPERGAVFYQDGGYFNAAGELLFEDRPATSAKIVESEETVVDSETGETKTKIIKTEVPVVDEGEPKDILAAWLKGDVRLNHGAVRGLVKKGYGQVLATRDEIIDYLVNEANLVSAESVKVKPAAVGK